MQLEESQISPIPLRRLVSRQLTEPKGAPFVKVEAEVMSPNKTQLVSSSLLDS